MVTGQFDTFGSGILTIDAGDSECTPGIFKILIILFLFIFINFIFLVVNSGICQNPHPIEFYFGFYDLSGTTVVDSVNSVDNQL